MALNTEKFPKGYNIDEELWKDEGQWRKYMTSIYQGRSLA